MRPSLRRLGRGWFHCGPRRGRSAGVPAPAKIERGRARARERESRRHEELRGPLSKHALRCVTGYSPLLKRPGRLSTRGTGEAGWARKRISHFHTPHGGSRTLRRSAGGCTKRLGAAGTRGTRWKTASASPPSGGRPRLVRRPHPQRTLHKDRKGGDLFLFTHLTVERCPFLFIYLPHDSDFGARDV